MKNRTKTCQICGKTFSEGTDSYKAIVKIGKCMECYDEGRLKS